MNEFLLQPGLYQTGRSTELFQVLDSLWPKSPDGTDNTFYIVSGFGSFNGGVSFYERFRAHTNQGGKVRAVFGGSRSNNMTSRQLVDALIDCGADVHLINRRHIMHSKLYGKRATDGQQRLVITSGNFTGPGIARNIESVLTLNSETTTSMSFDWDDLLDGLLSPTLEVFHVNGADSDDPRWSLLYDEGSRDSRMPTLEDQEDVYESLILTLSHSDTARIMAVKGTPAGAGTQYFWLSKDSYAFFPPLTIRNERGRKATYSCIVTVNFEDIGETADLRVTYEAENNLDFRLGTANLRYTRVARDGDMAVISRRSESIYDLKIVPQGTQEFFALGSYATTFIGARGKRYGYAPNDAVDRILSRN